MIIGVSHGRALAGIGGHELADDNHVGAAVDEVDGVQDEASAEFPFHGRSAIEVFTSEIGIFVGVARRPEAERADYKRIGILSDDRQAEARIALDAVEREILFVEADSQGGILARHLEAGVDDTPCGLAVGIASNHIEPVGDVIECVAAHLLSNLVVLGFDFEEAFGMGANRANLRRFLAYDDVTAVAAYPDGVALAREYDSLLDVLEQAQIALLVVALDGTNGAEFEGDFGESLFFGFFCHAVIHVGPLVVFALGGIAEVGHGVGNLAAVQKLEPQFGMLFLVVGSLFEEGCNLLVAVFLGLRCIIAVFVASLRFACKRFLKVAFSLCSF